ncbi:MAG TPA: hypothetical protein VGR69_03095 [Candidatus Rubrimentiphilum sp.]|nr:hypothetical protein [Candidatus Rubrimentiphilum sp.]
MRYRLATPEPDLVGEPIKISFSGLLEIAVREFLKRPADATDGRFEVIDEPTIYGLLGEYANIGPRRSTVSISP